MFCLKWKFFLNLACLAVLASAGGAFASTAGKPVLAHYMPWYVAPPYSGNWGWHWTMNHFNPTTYSSSGERQIASWYYPAIGPYDSADPAVLEYHVVLMKLAGLDGVIVDWYGSDNYLDYGVNEQRTAALFTFTRKAGLKFCLCYEDATIQQEVNGGYINATNAIAHAQQTMLYAQSNYFTSPGYLRWSGRPVLLNFGPRYFTQNSQWQSIFSVLNATNQPAFFPEDNRLPVGVGAFDWPPMWLSQTNSGVLTTNALESYLVNFQQNGGLWPAYISSAFPRFHDIYAQAGVGASYGFLDDNGGVTLQRTLARAMTNASAMVQITTWNDYGEGTIVEPTVDYGYRDLGILQDYRRQYLDAAFPYHTNDLALAQRLYNLRRSYATNAFAAAELDRVFTNIISGNLNDAGLRMTGVEAGRPVIDGVSCNGVQLHFSVGGYVSPAGVLVQSASNLLAASWQTVQTLPASTNSTTFTTSIASQSAATFFRVQNAGP